MKDIITDLKDIIDKLKGKISGSGQYKETRIKELEAIARRLNDQDTLIVI